MAPPRLGQLGEERNRYIRYILYVHYVRYVRYIRFEQLGEERNRFATTRVSVARHTVASHVASSTRNLFDLPGFGGGAAAGT